MAYNSLKILTERKDYRILHEYETAYIIKKNTAEKIYKYRFYGDPKGALIDVSQRFAVIYGCGSVIFFFKDNAAFEYGVDEFRVEEVTQNKNGTLDITEEGGRKYTITISGKNVNIKEKV